MAAVVIAIAKRLGSWWVIALMAIPFGWTGIALMMAWAWALDGHE